MMLPNKQKSNAARNAITYMQRSHEWKVNELTLGDLAVQLAAGEALPKAATECRDALLV